MFFPCFIHCSVLLAVCFDLFGVINFFFRLISLYFLPVIGFAADVYCVDCNSLESGKEMIPEEA